MDQDTMRQRTEAFGLRVIRVVESLPRSKASTVIGNQLLRCGTSIGSNYRAATRARSKDNFIAKLGIVEEETDESAYWLEMLAEAGLIRPSRLGPLQRECDEILSILVGTLKTAKQRRDA